MASYRTSEGEDKFMALPGDDVMLTTVTAGQPPKDSSDHFTIVDLYESKMSEYDSQFVFVPIRKLQELRGMIDPTTGVGRMNVIQIKLKPGADGERGARQAASGLFAHHVQYLHLARQAERLAGGRADGDRPFSTCCCF